MNDSNSYDDYFEPDLKDGQCVRCSAYITPQQQEELGHKNVCAYCLNLLLKDD